MNFFMRVNWSNPELSRARAYVAKATANTLCPLAEWSARDVWCCLVTHGLPWLTIYDHLGPAARNGIIGRNGEAHGRLVYLRKHYPAAYQEARRLGLLNSGSQTQPPTTNQL
jgi:3'-phosphoadenosine 5'-phosphosulfate sulfotransferase (PAPS reductase)/FAD synthetase